MMLSGSGLIRIFHGYHRRVSPAIAGGALTPTAVAAISHFGSSRAHIIGSFANHARRRCAASQAPASDGDFVDPARLGQSTALVENASIKGRFQSPNLQELAEKTLPMCLPRKRRLCALTGNITFTP